MHAGHARRGAGTARVLRPARPPHAKAAAGGVLAYAPTTHPTRPSPAAVHHHRRRPRRPGARRDGPRRRRAARARARRAPCARARPGLPRPAPPPTPPPPAAPRCSCAAAARSRARPAPSWSRRATTRSPASWTRLPRSAARVRRGGRRQGRGVQPAAAGARQPLRATRPLPLPPPIPRADLVFLQNGMLQPWLDSRGLGDNTQARARAHAWRTPFLRPCRKRPGLAGAAGQPSSRPAPHTPPGQLLVYFAVAKLGDAPTDGKTDVNPEGLSAAYGVHAEARARARGGACVCPAVGCTPAWAAHAAPKRPPPARAPRAAGRRGAPACGRPELQGAGARGVHAGDAGEAGLDLVRARGGGGRGPRRAGGL